MKYLVYIFLFSCTQVVAQNDFETRYYTINLESLPNISKAASVLGKMPKQNKGSFNLGAAPSYQNTKNSFTITASNYWQPVDMADALTGSTIPYSNSQFTTTRLQEKQFGITIQGSTGQTSFDFGEAGTQIKNDVYINQQHPFLNPARLPMYRNRNSLHHRRRGIDW